MRRLHYAPLHAVTILLLLYTATHAQDVELWNPSGSDVAKEYDVPADAISGLRSYSECQWRPREIIPFAVLKAEDEAGKPFWGIMVYTGVVKRDITIERYAAGSIGPTFHVLHVDGGGPGPDPPPDPPDPDVKTTYDMGPKLASLVPAANRQAAATVFDNTASNLLALNGINVPTSFDEIGKGFAAIDRAGLTPAWIFFRKRIIELQAEGKAASVLTIADVYQEAAEWLKK